MAIFGSFGYCLPNILHTWPPHDSFQVIRLSMTLSIFQGHWTVSHQISQKRFVIRQKLLWTTNRKSYTSFRLVLLLMSLKYTLRSFQPMLSFPRPFQQSLACFRVSRSPSNSWASCFDWHCICVCVYTPMYVCVCVCVGVTKFQDNGLQFAAWCTSTEDWLNSRPNTDILHCMFHDFYCLVTVIIICHIIVMVRCLIMMCHYATDSY